jgi:hypothetical protein
METDSDKLDRKIISLHRHMNDREWTTVTSHNSNYEKKI